MILFLTQYGIFIRYHSEEMKIFANSIAEKTKSERDADIFKMRYTEKHQSENININEIKSRIIRVRWGGQILFRIAE